MIENKTYQEEYEEFWKEIVENDDGTLNKDQIMRELSDYLMIINNCESAYSEMTEGNVSKANTQFWEVKSIFEDKFLSKDITQDDIKEMIDNVNDIEELKKELIEYFEINKLLGE